MKRILLINNGYPSKTRPNYVTYIQSIKDCLQDAGFEVDLLVLDSNFHSKAGKYINFFRYYLRLFFFGKYKRYDYIYINNYPYSFLPMIFHFPRMKRIIIHWHGDDIFPGSKFSGILNKLSYMFVRKDVIHMAPSSYFAKETAQRLGISADSIVVSPSGGVDTDLFIRRPQNRRRQGLVRLGFASGLLRSKGMDLVVALVKDKADLEAKLGATVEFHFIDYGAEKEHYKMQMSGIEKVVIHPPYPIHDMVSFYNEIDVLLFPSLRRAESLGLVALEAMSCESPVIATDDFAFRSMVIAGQTGERFRFGDAADFKSAVIRCAGNPDLYKPRDMVIENFSKASVSRQYKNTLA